MNYEKNYEEKYKEALENLQKIKESNKDNNELVEFIDCKFPELKESEDEKMLNQLHEWMKEFGGAEEYTEKVYCWLKGLLEKQGELKDKEENKDNNELVEFIDCKFPELKESEDEKIRKELFEHCINRVDGKQVCVDANDYRRWADWLFRIGKENIPNVKSDEVIKNEIIKFLELPHPQFVGKRHQKDWLEKQGEKKSVDKVEPKFKVGDTMRTLQEASDGYTDGMPIVVSIDNEYYHCTNELIAIKDQDDYEFPPINMKQKPVDNVKPKFKVGDIIINEYGFIMQIGGIDSNMYMYHVLGDNRILKHDITKTDESCHLWTIQDAKDGDVLICGNQTFLFKCIEEKQVYCYGYIWRNEYKELIGFQFCNQPNQLYCHTDAVMSPATKEQCDTLFAEMKEAGYEWNAEKKELKKIESKTAELPKGENNDIDGLYAAIDIMQKTLGKVEGYQTDGGILEHECAISAVKKLYEQKHTWCEEDEKCLSFMIECLETCSMGKQITFLHSTALKYIDWLKSLKDRI